MLKKETQIIHSGNNPKEQAGFVSPPQYRGTTVLYDTVSQMEAAASDPLKNNGLQYGRFGNPNSKSFEYILSELEGGTGTICTGSGLSAITTAILSFVQTGDHILISDSVYFPTRKFCDSLKKMNITTEYYDPCIGKEIETLIRPETKLVYLESPGSLTFEVQDVPTIVSICKNKGVLTLIDNTWATPLYFKPLSFGVNVSIHAATKYITGHSDSYLGAIVCDEKTYPQVRSMSILLGQKAGSDDLYFGIRGLRTLPTRIVQHSASALTIAHWLKDRTEIKCVYHPALPTNPGHQFWKRDFTGASGVFAIEFKNSYTKEQVDQFANTLKLFGLGASWGSFESLIMPCWVRDSRKFGNYDTKGILIRIHIGLEDPNDLIKDLENALRVLSKPITTR